MAGLFDEPTIAFAQVAVERGVDSFPDGLTYGIPERLNALKPGQLVQVPLGKRNAPTDAWVLSISQEKPNLPKQIEPKQILECKNESITLPEDLLSLAKWMSKYYLTPIGPTLSTMLPGPVRKKTGLVTKQLVNLAPSIPENFTYSEKQQNVVNALKALPENQKPIETSELMRLASLKSRSSIDTLLKHEILTIKRVTRIEANWHQQAKDFTIPKSLTAEQQEILNSINDVLEEGYSSHLIFGITGSGKTEIYIRLIQKAIKDGGTALILVPEIALTPQTAARLLGRFPDKQVAILHSSLTKSQRHQQWALVAEGKADIVLGVRSAVFAPIPQGQLKIVVVDEEHEHSFKQDKAPRYHGRDVAIRRAWMNNCPIVLGSATPSMESWWNSNVRKISTLHKLKKRAPGLELPHIELIDMRKEVATNGTDHTLISRRLNKAISETLSQKKQVLLLLNRRGFAPWIACKNKKCDWMMQCEHCDAYMVFHRKQPLNEVGFVRCHHCAKEQRLPKSCPDCANSIIQLGAGTQRIEAILRENLHLPEKAIARLDGDTATNAKAIHDILGRFGNGEIQLLLGTQMIAKGLDFPNVKLVGVLNADTAIDLPDFRSSERTYQLVSQVCGRCGRGTGDATAIIQSYQPNTPAIQLASQSQYEQFANAEIKLRQSALLPPATRIARFIIRDLNSDYAKGRAEALVSRLESIATADITISQPAPCAMPRIANHFRYDCIITSSTSKSLQAFLSQARKLAPIGRDLAADIDPMSLL